MMIRLEKVKFGSIRSMAKVGGTIVCVSGAVVMALLRGRKLLNAEFKTGILPFFFQAAAAAVADQWRLGFFFLIASSICWSAWLILQVPICKSHLDPLSLSTWMSVLSALQTAVLALFIEPVWSAWKSDSTLTLLLCLYAGLGCGVSYTVQSWCISIRGPLFSAMFSPLCTVITTISAAILLDEELYMGSLVGGAAIVAGLYTVLWGKAKDINGCDEASRGDDDENFIKITASEKLSESSLEESLITTLDEHC